MEEYKTFEDWWKDFGKNEGLIKGNYTYETAKKIWNTQKFYNTQIAELSTAETNAKFQKSIIEAMENENFQDLNGKAAVAYLRQTIQTQELTEKQKGAWNRMLEHIGKWGEGWQDIAIILLTLVDRGLSNWKMPEINTGGKTININQEKQ